MTRPYGGRGWDKRAGKGLRLWTDGSFQQKDRTNTIHAGGAIVRTDGQNRWIDVLAFEFDASSRRLPILKSRDAERVTALIGLEMADPYSVGMIGSDNIETVVALQDIRKIIKEQRDLPHKYASELFLRFKAALIRQHATLQAFHFQRSEGELPIANAFAQAAARGDRPGVEAASRRTRLPVTFVNKTGQSFHYTPP